jgi:hypothetical protein
MSSRTKTNWELKANAGQLTLTQLVHLEQCITKYQINLVSAIEPFNYWNSFVNSTHGQMGLYAQQGWQSIDQIIELVDQQINEWVYVAINRYLLTCDPDSTRNSNYDQAIVEYFQKYLKNYIVIEYDYHPLNYTGSVGNFIVPDNRLLCKKIKLDH